MTERWLPVVGFEGLYEVSDLGRVRSVAREVANRWGTRTPRRQRVLAAIVDCDGYIKVNLNRDGASRQRPVHQLVLEAFVGPRPAGAQTLHANAVRNDNRAPNLSWGSASDNCADRDRHGNGPQGERNPRAKLTEEQVRAIRVEPGSHASLARQYGVKPETIRRIRDGRQWGACA